MRGRLELASVRCPSRLLRASFFHPSHFGSHLWPCALVLLLSLAGVGYAQPLSLEAVTPPLVALPRATVSLALRLENTGNAPWRGTPELSVLQGWRALLPPEEVALGPGERYLALFTVLIGARAEAGAYTLPVRVSGPAGAGVSATYTATDTATFTVTVQEVRALEAVLLDAPPYVVAAPYTARFSVRNAGNSPEQVALRARDNLALPLSTDPAALRLGPGEAAEVSVRVGVSADLGRSERHTLYLEASLPRDPEVTGRADATVELIPRAFSEASAYHLFPLRVRVGERLSGGPQAVADPFGGLNLSASGVGKLWEDDPGFLTLQLGAGPSRTGNTNLVSYESPEVQVAAGRQSLSLTPLTSRRTAVGLDAEGALELGDPLGAEVDMQLGAQVLAYTAPTDAGVGVRASAGLGSLAEVGAYSLASAGPYGTVVGGLFGLYPEFGGEGGVALTLETEYGVQTDTGARGFRVGGEAGVGGGAASASWQQAEAGFQAASDDRYTLTASGALALSGWALPTYLSGRFEQRGSYLPGELLVSPPERLERSWSGRVSSSLGAPLLGTGLGAVGVSLRYTDQHSFGVLGAATRSRRELGFGVSLPFSQGTQLRQDLSWLREFRATGGDTLEGDVLGGELVGELIGDETLGYDASAVLALGPGTLTPRLGGAYSLLSGGFTKALFGLGWSGSVDEADSVALALEGTLELSGERPLAVSAVGSYGFAGGQALDVDLRGRAYYSSREPSLELALGYSLPLEVLLGRLASVGEVVGRFVDEAGAGVPGLVVQLGGLSVLTQADGSFSFPAVPEGAQALVLVAAGGAPDQLAVPLLPYEVGVRAGETVAANFRVVRPAAVRGQVRFVQSAPPEGGSPAGPGVEVIFGAGRPAEEAGLVGNLVAELRSDGVKNGDTVLRVRTDAEGRFQFDRLPPGRWRLTLLRGSLPELYRLTPASQLLTLEPGGTARAEVELEPMARKVQFRDGGSLSTP